MENCNEVLTYNPSNVQALEMAAQISLRRNDPASALEYQRHIVGSMPNDHAALTRLVQMLQSQKREREAVQATQEALQRNPSSPAFLEDYLRCLLAANNPAEAERVSRAFLAASPNSEVAALLLADVEYRAGNTDEATKALQSAENCSIDKGLFLRQAVAAAIGGKDFDRAVTYAERLVKASPDDPSCVEALLRAQMAAGHKEEALAAAAQAAQSHPDSWPFIRLACAFLSGASAADQAISLLESFEQRQPDSADARLMLCSLQLRGGQNDKALAGLKAVEPLVSQSFSAERAQALIQYYTELKHYSEAEAVGRKLCERAPNAAQSWLALAGVLEAQGPELREKKIDLYREALARPLRGRAIQAILANNLAYAIATAPYSTPDKKERALQEAETMMDGVVGDRETASTELLDTLGWIKLLRNRTEEAATLLEMAAGRTDASPETLYHYALACARSGKARTAVEFATRAVDKQSDHPEWLAEVQREIEKVH
jgi:predicted Zn-dependent protease